MDITRKKFVFCSPVTPIYEIHRYRPYFEFPNAASNFGFDPYLLIGKENLSYNGKVKIIETGFDSNKHTDVPKTFPFLIKFMIKEKPDVFVFFHMNLVLPIIVSFTRLFRWGRGVKFVLKMDWDGSKFKQLGNFMTIRNFLLAIESFFVDSIIIENSCGYNSLLTIPLVNKKKIIVLPNGYSNDLIQEVSYSEIKREPIILIVSRVSPEKGIDILISAFSELKNEYPEWKLKIVGPIEDKKYYKKCQSLIQDLNMQSLIFFAGPHYGETLKMDYYHSSIFCLPSLEESFGIVRMEAIAAGLPLITSDAGCGIDFEHYGSLVFESGNIAQLRKGLKKLMESETTRKEISRKQQESIISYNQIIKKLLQSLDLII